MNEYVNFLDSVINSVAEHLAIIDASGLIRYVNQTWIDFGISNGCITSSDNWGDVNYLDVCEAAAQRGDRFGHAASDLVREVISGRRDSGYLEYPCDSPTEPRWFMMRIRPLRWDGPPHFALTHHNITERKLTEIALKDHETRLRAIFNHAADGITTIDEQGKIETLNPAAERLFGYQAAELTGQSINILLTEPYRIERNGYLPQDDQTDETTGIGTKHEVVGQRKDGSTFPLDLALSEMRLDNRQLFTGLLRDISDRKAAEANEQAYAEKLKADIAAATAELQNMTTAIDVVQGTAELALDGTILTANKNFLDMVGYHLAEIQGHHHRLFCNPTYAASQDYREHWARLNRGETVIGVHKRISKGGKAVWIQACYYPLPGRDGSPSKVIKFAVDVTLSSLAPRLGHPRHDIFPDTGGHRPATQARTHPWRKRALPPRELLAAGPIT